MTKAFGVVDLLGLTGDGNPLADFVCLTCTPRRSFDEENVRDEFGEFLPTTEHAFNETIQYEAEYESKLRTEFSGIEIVTGGAEFMHITRLEIVQQSNKYARIRVTAHEHPESNRGKHLDNERTIALPDFLGFGASDIIEAFASDLDVQETTYTVTLDHIDEPNNLGGHLVGITYGERHECSQMGVIDQASGFTAGADWKIIDIDPPRSNTAHRKARIKAVKLVAAPERGG